MKSGPFMYINYTEYTSISNLTPNRLNRNFIVFKFAFNNFKNRKLCRCKENILYWV